jgi:hypothetical protein
MKLLMGSEKNPITFSNPVLIPWPLLLVMVLDVRPVGPA